MNKPFNPVNIKVKKINNETNHKPLVESQTCHYCKFLYESCNCDDQAFYEKYMNI